MKIQYASDLHLEFSQNSKYLKENRLSVKGDILLLAGDISYIGDRRLNKNPFWDWAADNSVRKTNGEQVRSEDISKHKNDVFRIATTFTDSDTYEISETLKTDLRLFLEMVGKDGIGTAGLCKDLGLRNEITIEVFTERIKKTFGL